MRYWSKRARERAEYDPLDPAKQHEPEQAGALVASFLDGRSLAGVSDASRALMTWRRICGRRAASHTVAVWLNRPKKGSGLPELVVYLDGNALMADLTTNAELFCDRMAWAGMPVARVRFRLSRKAGSTGVRDSPAVSRQRTSPARPAELPPLTPAEAAQVAQACAQLPDRLRESASEAMSLSLRRQRAHDTDKGANPSESAQ